MAGYDSSVFLGRRDWKPRHNCPGHVAQHQVLWLHWYGRGHTKTERGAAQTEDLFWSWAGNTAPAEMVRNEQPSFQDWGDHTELSWLMLKQVFVEVEHFTTILNSAPGRDGRPKLDVHNIIYWFKNTRAALRRAEIRQIRSSTFNTEELRSHERLLWVSDDNFSLF